MEHLHAIGFNSYFFEQLFGLLHFFFCSKISLKEMAIAFLSASDESSVGAVFKGFHEMQGI